MTLSIYVGISKKCRHGYFCSQVFFMDIGTCDKKWSHLEGTHSSFFLNLKKPVAVAKWLALQTAEQEVGSSNPSIPPLLKHRCEQGDWLLCWHHTLAKVLHQRWIAGNIYITYTSSKAAHSPPRGEITRSQKQGYQWPHKWTCVQQIFLKKF